MIRSGLIQVSNLTVEGADPVLMPRGAAVLELTKQYGICLRQVAGAGRLLLSMGAMPKAEYWRLAVMPNY